MIRPVADAVGVPYHRIFANTILFDGPDGKGEYCTYDSNEFTCRDGGKARALQHIRDELGVTGKIVMVGDGVTDVQAKPPADVVIGYGGIVVREPVKEGADWFVDDFQVSLYAVG
jgi:phosphoserine phosphatase